MTSLELPAKRRRPPDRPLRVRIPASRGGLAWIAVLLIIGTFLAVQVGRQVYTSWSIGQEADAIRAEIAAMEAHNEALREELAFLQSKGFVSAEARRLLNLGLPGSTCSSFRPVPRLRCLRPCGKRLRPPSHRWSSGWSSSSAPSRHSSTSNTAEPPGFPLTGWLVMHAQATSLRVLPELLVRCLP